MYMVIRRKVAVGSKSTLPAVVGEKLPKPLWHSVTELARALSEDARCDGQESGAILVEVTDGAK